MAYREVTMLEVKEVLRLWLDGVPKKRIAAQLRVDRKTVRRYVAAAVARGLAPGAGQPRRAPRHRRAAARPGRAALEGAPVPRASGRRGPVRDAAPLRRRRVGLRPRLADRPRRRLRAGRGGPA